MSGSGREPRLRLMTSAPVSAAYAIPFVMSAVRPALSSLSTRTGISFVSGATPAIPVWLFAVAAIVPATWLPCPWKSSGVRVPEVPAVRVVDEAVPVVVHAVARRLAGVGPDVAGDVRNGPPPRRCPPRRRPSPRPGWYPRLERVHVHARHAGLPSTVWPVFEAPELAEVGVVARRGPTLDRQVRLGPLHPVRCSRARAAARALPPFRRSTCVEERRAAQERLQLPRGNALRRGGAVLGDDRRGRRRPSSPRTRRRLRRAGLQGGGGGMMRRITSRPVERERTPLDQKSPRALPPEGRLHR